ncbi:molybdopterin molybdotransferase MoeA [Jatrophihabitans telluris]|uniref:Molybdopterin molybdenumtransferase n=1 Tax=Jatrophihabitans telluris TaxID=2038343 RepID=A0ABY4R0D4_9ACTN|nr:gephyrin-like molybdotransferase Glp [Jatrophihabitans telluris]UQX89240.1 molybdopterin molybdotransferase MoeA [Jatrophihabitans telluris]
MTENNPDQPTEVISSLAQQAERGGPGRGAGHDRDHGRDRDHGDDHSHDHSHDHEDVGALRPVSEQLARVLDSIGSIDPIQLTLLDAQGLLLAEPITADRPLPGFDNSAMDGYAVRAVDLRDASPERPVVLPVVGDVVAGARSVSGMGPNLAMRIMTGAPIPPGADAVIPLEQTDRGVARVSITRSIRSGECIRRAGEDLAAGAVALGPGAALGPQQIALLAATGHDRVLVRPRPRVVIISTGSELIDVGRTPGFGEVPDANSYMLAAAARDAGADAFRVGIVADDHDRLLDVLDAQLNRADLIITSGGVSMGAYDVVKEALSQFGTVEFVKVAMQPGMPQGFGYLGREHTPIFCLPGNPVSSLVSFEVFVRPAIRKLLGKRNVHRQSLQAISLERIDSPAGKRQFRRGLLQREPDGRYSVSLVGGAASHLIASLAASNCLVVIDEDTTEVVPGSRVTVLPLMLAQR